MAKVLALITTNDWRSSRSEVDAGLSPRRDFLELASTLGADIFDLSAVRKSGVAHLLEGAFRRGAGLAWLASRRQSSYDVIFSDGEHIGLPLGALLSLNKHRPRHVMIGHWLSPWRKRQLGRLARRGIDTVVVHSQVQRSVAINRLQFEDAQVRLTPYQVDTLFWGASPAAEQPLIVSCGLEQRDYVTLLAAVSGFDINLTIAAASHWSQSRGRLAGDLPRNVTVRSLGYAALRDLYASARFVIVPLKPADFQAGITTILEAMAAGKAVIATRTKGQQDAITGPVWTAATHAWPEAGPPIGQASGIYVRPRDDAALRSAIVYLLDHPDVARALGANGRASQPGLDTYVQTLAGLIGQGRQAVGALQAAGR